MKWGDRGRGDGCRDLLLLRLEQCRGGGRGGRQLLEEVSELDDLLRLAGDALDHFVRCVTVAVVVERE